MGRYACVGDGDRIWSATDLSTMSYKKTQTETFLKARRDSERERERTRRSLLGRQGQTRCSLRMWATVDKHPHMFVLGQSVSNHHGDCSYRRQHRTLRKTTPQRAGKEQHTAHPRQEPSPHREKEKKRPGKGIKKYCNRTLG